MGNKPKVLFVSLGCDKNRVDTEKMMELLSERGYEFTDDGGKPTRLSSTAAASSARPRKKASAASSKQAA
jgi:topoisomerase IA-like protein